MVGNKTIFCILFALLVFTSFVSAEGVSSPFGGGAVYAIPIGDGGGSGGGGGGSIPEINDPFEDIEVEINDVGINYHENLILPLGERIKIDVEFESEVDDTDVTVNVEFGGQGYHIRESTESFDVEEGDDYRKTLYLDLPNISQEEHYYLTVGVYGEEYGKGLPPFHHILMDDYCEFGEVGDLHADINDIEVAGFGNKYSWYPLDEIEVEVEIDNDADEGIDDIFLEWGIYDIEANEFVFEGVEGDFYLDEGEDMEFLFTFSLHPDELDFSNERYFLFVKIYGDEGEHAHCYSDSKQIKFEIDDNFVILNNIEITPNPIIAGTELEINANVWNIGEDDQDDVYVRIYNNELEIDRRIDVGDIDFFESEELSTTIQIPENADEKTYEFTFEVYDEDNDVYENDNDDESRFIIPIFVERGLEIEILNPADGSIVKGDFTSLVVSTNENAVCEYGLKFTGPGYGAISNPTEMETTGGRWHSQSIEHLEETQEGEKYEITITCTDGSGNSAEAEIEFYVDLSELREVMILEDIGDYEYQRSIMFETGDREIDDDFIAMYSAEYNKNGDDYIYSAGILEFQDESYFDEFLDAFDEGISITIKTINGHKVYFLDEGDGDYGIFWFHENLMIYIMAEINPEPEIVSEIPYPLVEAYLEKYSSDLDSTPPTIELISPEDDYKKRTKKSFYEIDFKFKVSDESEIVSCSLIIDGKIEETKTNVQKDVELVFSVELDRGSYDWQIKCVDSEGNERFSEIRDLKIKKKKKSSGSNNVISFDDPYYETLETTSPPINNIIEEPEVITLNPKTSKESKGFFESIWDWFKELFS